MSDLRTLRELVFPPDGTLTLAEANAALSAAMLAATGSEDYVKRVCDREENMSEFVSDVTEIMKIFLRVLSGNKRLKYTGSDYEEIAREVIEEANMVMKGVESLSSCEEGNLLLEKLTKMTVKLYEAYE